MRQESSSLGSINTILCRFVKFDKKIESLVRDSNTAYKIFVFGFTASVVYCGNVARLQRYEKGMSR